MRSKYLREIVDNYDMNRMKGGAAKHKMSLLPAVDELTLQSADENYLMGRVYFANGKNHESIEMYIKATEKYKALGDLVGEAYACIYCSMNYREIRNFAESRKLTRRAYDIGVEISDSYIVLFSILVSIVTYSYEGMQAESDKLRINTEAMVKEVGHPKLAGDYYNNSAHALMAGKRYDEALEQLDMAYEFYLKHYDTKRVANVLIVLGNRAKALVELGRLDEAMAVFDDIEQTVRGDQEDIFMIEVLRGKIDAMRVRGDFNAAYHESRRLTESYSRWMKSLIRHPRVEVDMMREDLKEFEARLAKMNEELTIKNRLLDKMTKNNELVRQVGSSLAATHNVEQILEVVAHECDKFLKYNTICLALVEGDNAVVRHAVVKEGGDRMELPYYLPLSDPSYVITYCINSDVDLMVREKKEFFKYISQDDFDKDGRVRDSNSRRNSSGKYVESAIFCPLRYGGEILGLLTIQDYNKASFDEFEFEVIKEIASFISLAIINSRKNDEVLARMEMLASISLQDPLTGLGNRRAFNLQYKKMLEEGDDFALMFVDMNHLKVINDTEGHDVGDRYLMEIGRLLGRECRDYNVYRLSGDEFAVLAPGASKDVVEEIISSIKSGCEQIQLGEYPLAVSVGCAFSTEANHGDDIFRSAEARMYLDKHHYYISGEIKKNNKVGDRQEVL